MDNYQQVLLQMQEFGIEFRDKDLPLELDTPKSKTCGKGGKDRMVPMLPEVKNILNIF